jgi:hypothetical protein
MLKPPLSAVTSRLLDTGYTVRIRMLEETIVSWTEDES